MILGLSTASVRPVREPASNLGAGAFVEGPAPEPNGLADFICISAVQQYYDAMRIGPEFEASGTVSSTEAEMRKGERIRLRPASPGAREWSLPREAEGTVLCHYRVFAGRPGASDRMDVRFSPKTVIWGAPATEFEPVPEGPEPSSRGGSDRAELSARQARGA